MPTLLSRRIFVVAALIALSALALAVAEIAWPHSAGAVTANWMTEGSLNIITEGS